MKTFYKFPRTPHLFWLSPQLPRDDKVMTLKEVEEFLAGPVIVEEKLDGANLGLRRDDSDRVTAQNRGNILDGPLTGQWERLRSWLAQHELLLKGRLPMDAIVFGEWCYAQHTIKYTQLPDWFIGFDVFESKTGRFWNTERRDALLADLGIASIHRIAHGKFTQTDLKRMLSECSAYYDGPLEGLYLRREDSSYLLNRAKLVRADFVQGIGEHWSRKGLHANRVVEVFAR